MVQKNYWCSSIVFLKRAFKFLRVQLNWGKPLRWQSLGRQLRKPVSGTLHLLRKLRRTSQHRLMGKWYIEFSLRFAFFTTKIVGHTIRPEVEVKMVYNSTFFG